MKKLCLLTLPTMLLLGLVDLGIGSYAARKDYHSFRISHPYFHHGFRPMVGTETEWGGTRYPVFTNSLGLRDTTTREVGTRSSQTRVLLMGDSFIEGIGLSYEETVAGLLAKAFQGKGIEVLNGATVSYSPKLYYLKTRFLLEQRHMDIDHLLVFIDISDPQDEIHYQSFSPAETAALVPNFSWIDHWQSHSLAARNWSGAAKRKRAISNQFDFRKMADIDVWISNVDAYTEASRPQDAEAGRWDWTIRRDLFEAWGERGLALAAQQVRKLHELCETHHVSLTIAVYPSPAQIFANDLNSVQVNFWSSFCKQENIPFINLFPVFIHRKFSGPMEVYTRYFIANDTHWNASGHWMVANEIQRLWDLVVPPLDPPEGFSLPRSRPTDP